MDLPEAWLFGGSMPDIVWAGARRLILDDPRTRTRYLEHLETFFAEHLILEKAQQLEIGIVNQSLQMHEEEELERLDALRIQGMIQAERKCRKLHTRPYGWTPELTRLMTEICYWRAVLRQVEGRPYNAWFLRRLAQALNLPINPATDTGVTI